MLNQHKVMFISTFLLSSFTCLDMLACYRPTRQKNQTTASNHTTQCVVNKKTKIIQQTEKANPSKITGEKRVQTENLETVEKEEVLPLTPEEQAQKDIKRAAKGGAYGGLAGAVAWEAGTWCAHHTLAAAGTSLACPPFGTVVCAGIVIGALYGYATSE